MNTGLDHCLVIAEAGVNHNGAIDKAIKLIDVAADSGADIVKFQTFKSSRLVSRHAPKARYQINATGNSEGQLAMLQGLELSIKDHRELVEHCKTRNIVFLSTPFDEESANFLVNDLGVTHLKVPSGEITNGPFLLAVAQLKRPVILSTGMSTLGEIEEALGVLAYGYMNAGAKPCRPEFREAYASEQGQQILHTNVILLHCTSEYPAPFSDINLAAMDTLRSAFGLPVGLSDHSEGIAIPIAATAKKAAIIEKHFTLDRSLPGPDHLASLEPRELTEMVRCIRQVESAIGNGIKRPLSCEFKNIPIARKSLIATAPIASGERLTEKNIGAKRPGSGVSPMEYWSYLGKPASRNYQEDEPLD